MSADLKQVAGLRQAGLNDQIPIIPPDAELSPNSTVDPGQRGKTPGYRKPDGTWIGYVGWTQAPEASWQDVERWVSEGASIGVRSRFFPGVDIDIADAALVRRVRQLAEQIIGPAAGRTGKPPRVLLPYKLEGEPFNGYNLRLTRGDESGLIEIKAAGQQYVISGLHQTTKQPYVWDRQVAPLSLISREKVEQFFSAVRTVLEADGFSVQTTGGGKASERSAVGIPDAAPSAEKIEEALARIPNLPETDRARFVDVALFTRGAADEKHYDRALTALQKWSEQHPTYDEAETERVFRTAKPQKGWTALAGLAGMVFEAERPRLLQMNDEWAIIGGQCWNLRGEPEPWQRHRVVDHLKNQAITVKGKRVELFRLWMDWKDRHTCHAAVFDPTLSPRCDVPSRTVAGENDFNLWPGFALQPSKTGSCDLFRDHLLHVVCAGNAEVFRWVEMWLAHIVQAPARLAGTALALKGPQGAGKSIVGEVMRTILGPALHVSLSKPELVTGRFNSQHAGRLLLQVEEGFWAGDKAAAGALKHMITSDRVLIERKGIDPVELPNYGRVLVTSNADWVVPAGIGERRFAVLAVMRDRKDDRGYWSALRKQMFEHGGCARFMDHLLHHVTVDWDAISRPPQTAALVAQQIEGMGPEDQWLYSILQEGRLPGDVEGAGITACEELAGDFGAATGSRRWRSARGAGTRLGAYLKSGPLAGRIRRNRVGSRSSRRYAYEFPRLAECRKLFETHLGGRPDWEQVEEWEPSVSYLPYLDTTSQLATKNDVRNTDSQYESKKEVGEVREVGHDQKSQQLTVPYLTDGALPQVGDNGENPLQSGGWGVSVRIPLADELLERLGIA